MLKDWLVLIVLTVITLKLTPFVIAWIEADAFKQRIYRKPGGAEGREFGYYWD